MDHKVGMRARYACDVNGGRNRTEQVTGIVRRVVRIYGIRYGAEKR
jgi:hypothetical protein